MKKATIEIRAKFGSKFQQQFARDSLFSLLEGWKHFLDNQHKENDVLVIINEQSIKTLQWFDWENYRKGEIKK